MRTSDGGLDCTKAVVYREPTTLAKSAEEWRRPRIEGSMVHPHPSSREPGTPMRIIKYQERGEVASKVHDGRTYRVARDQNGFPEFTIYDTYIDDVNIGNGDDALHFRAANEQLAARLKATPGLADELGLTPDQQAFFERRTIPGESPPGLTWHHHEDAGRMQLVDSELHGRFGHVGGMNIWGGGR